MINTILVEDDIYMQKHFSAILRSDERFSIAGTFKDAFDVENRCGTDIDLVLMDVLTLHKHSGLAAGKRIKERYPHIKIVIITSLIDPNVLSEAKRGAADSLWYKDHGTEELLDVIIRTMNGERIFPGLVSLCRDEEYALRRYLADTDRDTPSLHTRLHLPGDCR